MTIIKHKEDCKMAFGKKDKTCPRCQELLNGALPRGGWQKQYYTDKKESEAKLLDQIANHDCIKRKCGAVCTTFDH